MAPSLFRQSLRARALVKWPVAVAAIMAMLVAGCGSSASSSTSAGKAPASAATGSVVGSAGGFKLTALVSGVRIEHATPSGKVPVSQPDDITQLGDHLFVGFQNQTGPQGEATPAGAQGTGNLNSTIVELSLTGSPIAQWDVAGHVDGVTADTAHGQVAVTTNEDANAHLFIITPGNSAAASYHLPALPHHGGLDAISFYHGTMLVSASAPGTSGKAAPQASYPAIYAVTLNSSNHTASVRGLFSDEASATSANSGKSGSSRLALVDPDSNAVVPSYVPHFGGDFELTSQGDYLQLFTANPSAGKLSALKLTQSVDDSAWASGPSGALYVTDKGADQLYKITGPFTKGMEIVGVTPCDAGNAPASCPGPGFPNNYMGVVNESTGAVSKFPEVIPINAAGLLFVP